MQAEALTRNLEGFSRFFDVGVLNGSLSNFNVSSDRKGMLYENLCLQMLFSEAKGRDTEIRVSSYRTDAGAEVDFIVEKGSELYAIEVKATRTVASHDMRGLKSFSNYYGRQAKCFVVYMDERPLQIDNVQILPLDKMIQSIFA